MLMTMEDARKVVEGCELSHEASNNTYCGTRLADVRTYSGRHGNGYAVSYNRRTSYYTHKGNEVSSMVYAGEYSVADAVMASNTLKRVAFRKLDGSSVYVTPTWRLDLNTLSGETVVRVSEEYKPITMGGRVLSVWWFGTITEKKLKSKIRRKLKALLREGKAREV